MKKTTALCVCSSCLSFSSKSMELPYIISDAERGATKVKSEPDRIFRLRKRTINRTTRAASSTVDHLLTSLLQVKPVARMPCMIWVAAYCNQDRLPISSPARSKDRKHPLALFDLCSPTFDIISFTANSDVCQRLVLHSRCALKPSAIRHSSSIGTFDWLKFQHRK